MSWYILVFMTKDASVTLSDHFDDFIARQIALGRFKSASEVVAAGLGLLEAREAKVEALRAALIEGEQAGPSTPFDFDDFLARKNA